MHYSNLTLIDVIETTCACSSVAFKMTLTQMFNLMNSQNNVGTLD